MKALVIADCDDLVFDGLVERVDLVIALGDIAESYINSLRAKLGEATVLAVKGNHDLPNAFSEGIKDLHLTKLTISGTAFGGMNGSWKYKPKGHFLYSQEEARNFMGNFPSVDVFISHNSPRGIHERDIEINDHHQGFECFLDYINRTQPKVFLHGHQHVNLETKIGSTRVIGVYGVKYIEV